MHAPDRIMTEEQCAALAERIFGMRQGGGEVRVSVSSHWRGTLRWGRNRVTLAGDQQQTHVRIARTLHQAMGFAHTNQLSEPTLEAAVRAAERLARHNGSTADDLQGVPPLVTNYATPAIWSEATFDLTAEERGVVARALIDSAEARRMLSAGYLAAEAQAHAVITSQGQRLFARMTQARCSMTVRDPKGTSSGWAGKTSYDWAKIDGIALAMRALGKCVDSREPIALEPGRYTVILESQAVADLLEVLVTSWGRSISEAAADPSGPFWLRPGFSKLGLKVADERVTIGQDPADPELGVLPFWGQEWNDDPADPHRAVNWIENGVLTALEYPREYAVAELGDNLGLPNSGAFRMAGGETPLEEMIETTKRGILVTRFSGVREVDSKSLFATGFTRDGLWLVENGKITKAVKNFRFVDSPLFVLNNLEQLGPAEAVFRPGSPGPQLLRPAVVPALKARDFNFTTLVDAV